MRIIYIFLFVFFISAPGFSQSDSIQVKSRKNIIKWNLTPMMLVGPKSIVFNFERIVNSRQSFSVTAGYLELPPFGDKSGQVFDFAREMDRGGYDFAVDYRFYFSKRNKYAIPDGLYWGPFASVYNLNFSGESNITLDGQQVNTVYLRTDMMMYNLGIQLGYQFVIAKRFTIDLHLFGPSRSIYSLKFDINSDFSPDLEEEFYQKYEEFIQNLFPGGEVVFQNLDFKATGRSTINSFGFRYGIQLGYHF
jgi:hypothetical protein